MKKNKQAEIIHTFDNVEKVIQSSKNKLTIAGISIGIMLSIAFMFGALYQVSKFYDTYRVVFQTPEIRIKIYWPIVIEDRKTAHVDDRHKVISPIQEALKVEARQLTEQEIVDKSKYPQFINHIWERESRKGKDHTELHGFCLSQGKTNPFGYYPQGNHCFDSFTAGVRRLEKWYEVEGAGLSYTAKLCYYNGAGKVQVCPYLSYDFANMN